MGDGDNRIKTNPINPLVVNLGEEPNYSSAEIGGEQLENVEMTPDISQDESYEGPVGGFPPGMLGQALRLATLLSINAGPEDKNKPKAPKVDGKEKKPNPKPATVTETRFKLSDEDQTVVDKLPKDLRVKATDAFKKIADAEKARDEAILNGASEDDIKMYDAEVAKARAVAADLKTIVADFNPKSLESQEKMYSHFGEGIPVKTVKELGDKKTKDALANETSRSGIELQTTQKEGLNLDNQEKRETMEDKKLLAKETAREKKLAGDKNQEDLDQLKGWQGTTKSIKEGIIEPVKALADTGVSIANAAISVSQQNKTFAGQLEQIAATERTDKRRADADRSKTRKDKENLKYEKKESFHGKALEAQRDAAAAASGNPTSEQFKSKGAPQVDPRTGKEAIQTARGRQQQNDQQRLEEQKVADAKQRQANSEGTRV